MLAVRARQGRRRCAAAVHNVFVESEPFTHAVIAVMVVLTPTAAVHAALAYLYWRQPALQHERELQHDASFAGARPLFGAQGGAIIRARL